MKTRFLSLVLALVMTLSIIPVFADEAPEITFMYPSATITTNDNPILTKIRENTGINASEIVLTYDEYADKLANLIAADTLPDIFAIPNNSYLQDLVTYGRVLPLNDLLDQYGQDVLANKNVQNQLDGCCRIDGQVYAIPITSTESTSALAIRKDWLDKLGLEVPTTLDAYYEVLRAFTYDDPNGNGVQDTIGLAAGGGISHIFGAFGISQGRLNLVDGKAVSYFLHPQYLDAIKFLNKLYNEGLYEKEFATIETMAAYGRLWNGVYGAFEFNPQGTTQNWIGRYTEDPKPEFVYTIIRGPEGKGGTPRIILDSGWAIVINAKTANPEACMKWINYFCTDEGDLLATVGFEGQHFEWVDKETGAYKLLEPYASDANLWRQDGVVYGNFMEKFHGACFQGLNELTRNGKAMAVENTLPDAFIYGRTAIEEDLGGLLNDIVAEAQALLIVCAPEEVDALYAQYKELYLASGGEQYIEQATAIYNAEHGIQ